MNKKIIGAICAAVMVIFSACGNQSSVSTEEYANIIQDGIAEAFTEAQNDSGVGNKVEPSDESEGVPSNDGAENVDFQTVNYGETITTDTVEITIASASSSEEINPTDMSSVYSYQPDVDNEKYFYLTGNIKNVGGNAIDAENICVEFTFDDKYNYNGFVLIDDGGNDFYGSNLDPFDKAKFYFTASIPDELMNSYSSCCVKFGFTDDFDHYSAAVEGFGSLKNCYQITVTK